VTAATRSASRASRPPARFPCKSTTTEFTNPTGRSPRCSRRQWHLLRRLPQPGQLPYPGRAARPAAALAPRRVALELALRTFLDTPADLVVVSLPTPRFILLVFERTDVDAQAISDTLAEYPVADRSRQLRSVVDSATLPRLYAPFALAPTASGRDSLLAVPLA
jgi:hypothetical protein